jgi:uncharacterized protein (TIGR02996 family)
VAKKVAAQKSVGKKPATKSAATATVNLDPVSTAMTAGDAGAALLAALDAWRAARSPELADVIDVLDTRIAFPPIQDDLEWTKIAVTKNPLALGRLLATMTDLPASFLPNAVLKLAAFADDPRIGSAASGWILDAITQASSNYPFWTNLYKLLERIGDTRVIAAIDKRVKMTPEARKGFGDRKPKPSQFWGKFYAGLQKLREPLATVENATVNKAAIAKLEKQAHKLEMAAPKISGGSKSSKTEKGPALARAVAHATKADVPATIAALLDAWRDKRAPEIADLIDRASRLLPSYRATFPAEAKPAAAAWQAAFDRDPIAEAPRLIRHIHIGGAAAATEHVVALSTLPDDPRIAHRLAELAVNINISPERSAYWKSAWDLIARTGDVRVIPSLRQDFDDFSGTYYDHHRSGKRLVLPFLLTEYTSKLDAADHKALNQLAAALDNIVPDHISQERALIADVVANWDDEAPRLVYADWLIQRDHLAGELIVLGCKLQRDNQLSKSEDKQFKALRGAFRLPTYPFGAISDFKVVLDRGLPVQLEDNWNASPISMAKLADDLMLPLLDVIQFNCSDRRGIPYPEDLARVMLSPHATRLVRVENVPNELLGISDPRFQPRNPGERLADALEPLVKTAWKRDGKHFVRR